MAQQVQLTATVTESQLGQRLDQALAELFPDYSRSRIKEWILDDRVTVNGIIINRPKEKVLGGEDIAIDALIEEEARWEPQDIALDIVYEDEDILVINKPRDLVVHPGAGNPDGTVLNALLHHYPEIADVPRAGIVHRLDKDTTGLMVVAKTVPAQTRLVESLQEREITREYEAVAIGTMTAGGMVNEPISRHPTKRTHMSVHPMGKPAVTHYRIMEHFRAHTRLRLRLETGRTHQIRVHMAHINHPLVGDPLYGGRPRPPKGASEQFISVLRKFDRQALHATMLRLYHPISGIQMEWHAPLPQDMVELIEALQADTEAFRDQLDWL
ncbi:23S rRNA pseudouridine(1911/1915/1917) synthase RluD [Enterobacillus tribolii]|uniref:Pseudouridine synthase n=1 Tax=Enterobacillus tribolii TaxID=1487935 RepID=A0A370Q841_9GAMM|nr:23S rRNA pseudouridine(1911/1915/1917) synthase RluD [Enterobacillus tribolii]MBW7984540.1 23S rRNA pseudouridine(1911/1915/1917) synthase RluD [Enterobacillus tribolii]RDK84531.1 ribosomal large subunit pseudouridine synthase D [Enterobacillus tribolii]